MVLELLLTELVKVLTKEQFIKKQNLQLRTLLNEKTFMDRGSGFDIIIE